MKRLFLIALLFTPSITFAQEGPTADTLDWRQYYPLQIGNIWEYEWDNFPMLIPDYQRFEIIGDTVINDVVYFVQQEHVYNADLSLRYHREEYLRYDTIGHTIIEYRDSPRFTGESLYLLACDLSADFNQLFTCPKGDMIGISGGYCGSENRCGSFVINSRPYATPPGDTIAVASVKSFFHLAGPGITLAHGIGDIGGQFEGGADGKYLIYLRIDDQEYGSSTVVTSTEDESLPNTFAIGSVHPNPFQSTATLEINVLTPQQLTVEIVNVLGQAMSQSLVRAGTNTRVVIDGRAWPSGVYFLRVVNEQGRQATRTLILQR